MFGGKFCIFLLGSFGLYAVQVSCLLIFCLDVLPIIQSGILKSLTIILLLSIFHFQSVNMFYVLMCSNIGCIYIYNCYNFQVTLYHYTITFFFVSSDKSWHKVYFVCYNYSQPCFLLVYPHTLSVLDIKIYLFLYCESVIQILELVILNICFFIFIWWL